MTDPFQDRDLSKNETFEIFSSSLSFDEDQSIDSNDTKKTGINNEEYGLASLSPSEDEPVVGKQSSSRGFSPIIGDTYEEILFMDQQTSDSPTFFSTPKEQSSFSWNPTFYNTFSAFSSESSSSMPSSTNKSLLGESLMGFANQFEQITENPESLSIGKDVNVAPSLFGNNSFSVPLSPPSSGEYPSPLESLSGSEENDSTSPTLGGRSFVESVEHPLGEHPSRTLFVRNIHSNIDDDELKKIFEQYGPIRNVYTQAKHRGFVMISYFDIRHAKNARRCLQGKIFKRRALDIHYSIPKDNPSEKELNQGTLVVFNLDPATTNKELKEIFGKFGQIKEIRETPNKKQHKFIEFYDVRAAEKAMKTLQRTEIRGNKIKIEPSKPGGSRKNLQRSMGENSFDFRSRSVPQDHEVPSPLQQNNASSYPPYKTTLVDASPTQTPSPDAVENRGTFFNESPQLSSGINRHGSIRSRSLSHSEEDKYKYALNIAKVKNLEDTRTTLCIRNIPNKYTQELLLNAIDENHKGKYDFFYLPIDFKNRCNLGFAFINFIDHQDIVHFYEIWNNRKWELFHSEKVCEIAYARIQGKEALLNNYIQKNPSMVDDKQYRPALFFSDGPNVGKPEPFPMHLLKNT